MVPGGQLLDSHSAKKALLSWAAKFGLSKPVRKDLGYHSRGKDRSVSAYSRDVQAAPLRKLRRVEKAVEAGLFHPDKTRSGYFTKVELRAEKEGFVFVLSENSKKLHREEAGALRARCGRAGSRFKNCSASAKLPVFETVCGHCFKDQDASALSERYG